MIDFLSATILVLLLVAVCLLLVMACLGIIGGIFAITYDLTKGQMK